jgi:hypothetical protein
MPQQIAPDSHDPTLGSPAEEASSLADCCILQTLPEHESAVFATNAAGNTEPVGTFHYATLVRNRLRLQVVASWQVSCEDREVLARVAHLLGRASPGIGSDARSITTETTTVEIVLHGPRALCLLWCRDDRSTCDGKTHCDEGTEHPCTCPPSLAERRTATRHGRGCEPRVEVFFQLAQDPALGIFTFTSGSWSFAEEVINARNALYANGQPTRARLSLWQTYHRLSSGRTLTYTRPTLALVGTPSREPHRAA